MITLYHFGNAICAQKVRIALSEKQLAWTSKLLTPQELKEDEYLKVNPKGVVPSLLVDGKILLESRIISEFIEENFDGPSLMPKDAIKKFESRAWSKQVDDSLHLNIFILSFVSGMRDKFLSMPKEILPKALPGMADPVKRMISWDLLEKGYESTYVNGAIERMNKLFTDMNETLSTQEWLAGDSYSLADADLTPYAKRIENVGLAHLTADKPYLQRWIEKTRSRPSYKEGLLDWLSETDLANIKTSCEKATAYYQSR